MECNSDCQTQDRIFETAYAYCWKAKLNFTNTSIAVGYLLYATHISVFEFIRYTVNTVAIPLPWYVIDKEWSAR